MLCDTGKPREGVARRSVAPNGEKTEVEVGDMRNTRGGVVKGTCDDDGQQMREMLILDTRQEYR